MGSRAVLSLHLSEPADRGFRRGRSEHAHRCRPDLVPHRRTRGFPVAPDRAQGDLSEGDQSRSGRRALGFSARRSRFLFLTRRLDQTVYPMTYWIRLAAPAALVATVAAPAYAVQYLSVAQAQKLAFPSATNFTSMDSRAWKAEA